MTTNLNILVVGGAGYIGSHMVLALTRAGHQVVVLDNLSKGHPEAVHGAEFIVADMGDRDQLKHVFATHRFDAVMHFASFIEVAESMKMPLTYYQNNVAATLTLLDIMVQYHVQRFIFSSTAAVYGEPHYTPIDELHPLHPINPYGRSKRMVEEMLTDLARTDQLQFATLRYFNAAGADPSGLIGEEHDPESHLIPLILQVASGTRDAITVYGRDYDTPDGTCVRDYVHVNDICVAHLQALQALIDGKKKLCCNLGTGHGFSVQEVIDAARRITQHPIPVIEGSRRQGDPAVLVADSALAKRELNWQPQHSDLDTIIQHAWHYAQKKAHLISGISS